MFRFITKVPSYTPNQMLHNDLKLLTVLETVTKSYTHYHNLFLDHPNIITKPLSKQMPGNSSKRLRKKWCRDFLLE